MMAYLHYHSLSEAQQKREFFRRKNIWLKRGDCRWVLEHEDTKNEGRRYPLHQKVRIGDRRWEAVPATSLSMEKRNQIWENYPKIVYPSFHDEKFETRMKNLPQKLQTHVILEAMAPNLENVSCKFGCKLKGKCRLSN